MGGPVRSVTKVTKDKWSVISYERRMVWKSNTKILSGLSCDLYLHPWPKWPLLIVKNDLLIIMTPELELNDYLDSTLVTCTSGIANYHVRHYSDSDHAVQYCWPRDRGGTCADSGISVIQWFDNKSLSWTTWFHHFQAVADFQNGMMSIRWSSWYPILLSSPWLLSRNSDQELWRLGVLVRTMADRFVPTGLARPRVPMSCLSILSFTVNIDAISRTQISLPRCWIYCIEPDILTAHWNWSANNSSYHSLNWSFKDIYGGRTDTVGLQIELSLVNQTWVLQLWDNGTCIDTSIQI